MFDSSKFESNKIGSVLTLKYTDKDAFKNGTDIPFKTLKEVANYQSSYLKEATELAASEAKKQLEKDKSLEKVTFEFPYTVSANGGININVDRSKTFPGINGGDPVTKSKITVVTKDPVNKVSKARIRELEADLTKTLLS